MLEKVNKAIRILINAKSKMKQRLEKLQVVSNTTSKAMSVLDMSYSFLSLSVSTSSGTLMRIYLRNIEVLNSKDPVIKQMLETIGRIKGINIIETLEKDSANILENFQKVEDMLEAKREIPNLQNKISRITLQINRLEEKRLMIEELGEKDAEDLDNILKD